jgi:hypothetical protein
MKRPTLEEVTTYFAAKGVGGDEPDKFYDHYAANGWKQNSGLAIRDWKAAVRNWIRRIPQFKQYDNKANYTNRIKNGADYYQQQLDKLNWSGNKGSA